MQIEFERKTNTSAVENCPARYRVIGEEGGYVIQGKKVDDLTRAQLRQVADDEDAVWIPADLING
jgi:hypothetical protein